MKLYTICLSLLFLTSSLPNYAQERSNEEIHAIEIIAEHKDKLARLAEISLLVDKNIYLDEVLIEQEDGEDIKHSQIIYEYQGNRIAGQNRYTDMEVYVEDVIVDEELYRISISNKKTQITEELNFNSITELYKAFHSYKRLFERIEFYLAVPIDNIDEDTARLVDEKLTADNLMELIEILRDMDYSYFQKRGDGYILGFNEKNLILSYNLYDAKELDNGFAWKAMDDRRK